jgi:hypothetical protein
MLRRKLFDEWRQDNDVVTILYYLFLLHLSHTGKPAKEVPSFYDDVVRTATVALDEAPAILKYLKRLGAIDDIQKCHLTSEAINTVEDLFKKTFGTCDPEILRYNGLELQNQNESYRVKNWVEKATEDIQELFGPVEGMEKIEPNDLDLRKSKRIVTLNCGGSHQILTFMFMSTSGMSKAFEIMELVEHENDMLKWWNEQVIQHPEEYHPIPEPHIGIVAAVSYQSTIAAELRHKGMHSTGPINFEAITHYLRSRILKSKADMNKAEKEELPEKNRELRSKQYVAMVNAFKDHRGGVVPWYPVLCEIEAELSEYYASLPGMEPYWVEEDWLHV